MSITAVLGWNKAGAAEKERPKFEMAPAASYASHQTSEKVTIGAAVYDTAEKAHPAFGKLNPYEYGILPVLVVIQNDSGQTLRVDRMRVDYVAPDGSHIDATLASDVRYLSGPRQPKVVPGPLPTSDGDIEAPHLDISVFARGLLDRVVTRLYFPDEQTANAVDPVLCSIAAPARRATLIAVPEPGGELRFDIRLQGAGETVFFDV